MLEVNYNQFSELTKKFKNKSFEVIPSYADYHIIKGDKLLFFTDSLSQPMVLCWARIKKIKFIGSVLDIKGPLLSEEISQKQLNKFLTGFQKLPYKGFFMNSNTEYSVLFEEAARNAGFKRPIGQSNTNLTIKVDTFNLSPGRNWRRNVTKADAVNFIVEIKQNITDQDCLVIEKLHAENSKLKNLSYQLIADEIKVLCMGSNIEVCFLKLNGEPIAARIFSVEENISYDIFACNSITSRKNGATQFLMQNIFEYLAQKNIQYFDFSRIPVGKKGAQGVYDFKRSTRGEVIQYNGEWVFFKNSRLRHLYYFFNAVINKKDFY